MAVPLTLSSVPSQTPYIQYVATASQTVFPYPFEITQDSDLIVLLNGVQQATDSGYTLSGQGTTGGGNVTFTTGLTAGTIVTIYRNITISRVSQLTQNGTFLSSTFNNEFNKIYLIMQQLNQANGFALQIPNTNNPAGTTVLTPANYANKYLAFDSNGNPTPALLTTSGSLTGPIIVSLLTANEVGNFIYPQTPAELAASVTPTNYFYQPGDPRRYGAIGAAASGGTTVPSTDDSSAWQKAVSTGLVVLPAGWAFKVVTGANLTGRLTIVGQGSSCELYSDGLIVNVTSGTASVIDNFACYNITTPYVLSRNPNSWGTAITTLSQSNTTTGYMPTVNDPEYTTLLSTYPSIATQTSTPTLQFQGNASNIEVSRIFGRFVAIQIYDAVSSSVHDCDFRGGKGLGGIAFWNVNNQLGQFNKVYNNRVSYTSYSGVVFARNYDFEASDNHSVSNGESGIKTYQDTISGTDVRCYKGLIADNVCSYNYFDGLDSLGSFTTSTLEARYMKLTGNYCFQNGGDGMNIDGSYNEISDNWVGFNYRYGIWAAGNAGLAFSSVKNNHCYDNNQSRSSTQHDISITTPSGYAPAWSSGQGYNPGARVTLSGTEYQCVLASSNNTPPNGNYWNPVTPGGNHISGNLVYAGLGQNNDGIYAPGTNYVGENRSVNGAVFFWGNPGVIYSVVENNSDGNTGNWADQNFTIQLVNTSGTLQHTVCSDNSAFALSYLQSRILGSTNSLQNTPTGTDASTAFAYGAKISTTQTNAIVLNTAPQNSAWFDLTGSISYNSTGTALTVSVGLQSFNVNGVTCYRPTLQFYNATSGAAFALNTTNIASGKQIAISIKGKIA